MTSPGGDRRHRPPETHGIALLDFHQIGRAVGRAAVDALNVRAGTS